MGTAVRREAQVVGNAEQPHRSSPLRQNTRPSSLTTVKQGTMGNIGMYASGIPLGMLIDTRGPRWGVALGIILFGAGYYPIAKGRPCG